MSKPLSKRLHDEMDDTFANVVRTLKHSAEDLSADGERAVSRVAEALRDAAGSAGPQIKAMGRRPAVSTRSVAVNASREAKAHPIAACVAAAAAVAALIGVLAATRRKAA